MTAFSTAFSTIFPLCLYMALGYFLKRVKLFTPLLLKQMNAVCFYVFFPALLFTNLYNSDFTGVINNKVIPFAVVGVLTVFTLLFFLVPVIEKDNRKRGVMIQGLYRSNHILIGIPLINSLFGGVQTSVISILISVIVPVFNILAVVSLEAFRGKKFSFMAILKNCARNPLIITVIIGFIIILTGLRFPPVITGTLSNIAGIATTLALIILGGTLEFSSLAENAVQLVAVITGRLVVIPFVAIFTAIQFGFRGPELAALLAVFGSATTVSSYTMAVQMDGDGQLAGQIVALTSVLSMITLFFAIVLMTPYLFV